jgi:hypothetical protein
VDLENFQLVRVTTLSDRYIVKGIQLPGFLEIRYLCMEASPLFCHTFTLDYDHMLSPMPGLRLHHQTEDGKYGSGLSVLNPPTPCSVCCLSLYSSGTVGRVHLVGLCSLYDPLFRSYRTLTDRLLNMRLIPARKLIRRNVSYEFMNRQMVWHAFTVIEDFTVFCPCY